jgi:hypothetical protein
MMSRLPQDQDYWGRLTDRVMATTYRKVAKGWWRDVGRFALPLTIGAAAAVIVALIWQPGIAREPVQDSSRATIYGFAPADPLAVVLLTSTTPPTVATLIGISERSQ